MLGLAVAAVGAGAGFAIHKATGGSAAPLRDCAAPLATAQRELAKADAKLKALRSQDAKLLAAFRKLSAQLTAIEKQYPNHELPSGVYARYKAIQGLADAAYKRYSTSIAATNKLIASRNAIAKRYNAAAACKPNG